MAYTKQTWTDGPGGGTPLSATRLQHIEDGLEAAATVADSAVAGGSGVTAAKVGWLMHDDYTGTDDARLTSVLSDATAATYPPVTRLTNRSHSYATGNRAMFEGMRISGPEGYSNPERNSQTKMTCRLALSMTGGLFQCSGSTDIYGVSLMHLSFTGGSNARVIDQGAATMTLANLQMRDIYSSGLRNVLGSFATKLLIRAAQFDGSWEVNNCYDTAFHLGGSDCAYPMFDGMLLDSGTSFNTTGGSAGHPHLWLDFMEKSNVGAIYMTTEGPWGGILVSGDDANTTGGNMGGRIVFAAGIWEGRNAGAPCQGSVYRQDGGLVTLRDVTMNYGMSSPASQSHTPTDAGMAHIYGNARCYADGTTYDRATGVAETVPLFYCDSTSKLRVFNVDTLSKVSTWSGLPRVDDGGGTGITNDTTTTLI